MAMQVIPASLTLNVKIKEIVEAKQKSFWFEVKTFKPEAIAKRIIKEIEALHDPEMDADSGELEIIHRTANFDSVSLFKKAKEVAAYIDSKCHVKAVYIHGERGGEKGFEVKFRFYDNPVSYKYRHLEF